MNGELIRITVTIDNTYEDGESIRTRATAQVTEPAGEEGSDERSEWAWDHIHPLTGTDRTDGDSWYDVVVIESDREDLIPVGATYDFGY